ncbi:MAG: winged helix-turn-helix domain-containing protein [Candidatus Liptonbacteria bacterium]
MDKKDYWRKERIMKGVSNHRRIEILDLISQKEGLSLLQISKRLKVNFKTLAEHIRRMSAAGLVYKHSDGKNMCHSLSPRGKNVLTFLRTLE